MSAFLVANNLRLVLFFIFPVLVVGEDDGDEFSNNLLSDLGPLLQLFGERFAQQFMSQSMSWIDSFILAIAPLGIITAIVGAIRVGGPSWLRAVIGRARENKGVAEIELMSSTSDEVCELWNGQTIVRTMGKPQVLQVVYYLEDENDEASFRLCSVEELSQVDTVGIARLQRISQSTHPRTSTAGDEDIERWTPRQPATGSGEAFRPPLAKTLRELGTYAPNISLNNTPERAQLELWAWALCGIIIQSSVLVLAFLVTQYLQLEKAGQPVKGYALPLIILGTLLLGLGMFCCASVVEKGSKEKRWCPDGKYHGKKGRNLRVLWLQRCHIVSDQCFDAFALIARGPRQYILTSHPASTARTGSEGDTGTPGALDRGQTFKKRGLHLSSGSQYLDSKRFQAAAVFGTVIGLSGFALQFVGLRASHWSISIAQLIATALMTVVRVMVRRGLLQRPHAEPMIPNHEMDWLATRMARDPGAFWSCFSDQSVVDKYSNSRKLLTCCRCSWTIVAGNVDIDQLGGTWDDRIVERNSVVYIRQILGKLSNWTGPVSEQAVSVATAIEVVMDALLPSPEHESFTWSLVSWYGEHQGRVLMSARYSNGKWKADATQIEAILSLWLFHVREAEEARREDQLKNLRLQNSGQPDQNTNDWLREGGSALKKIGMRILSPNTMTARQNLAWWVGISEAQIQTATTAETPNPTSAGDNTLKIDRHRVIGSLISEGLHKKLAATATTKFSCCRTDCLRIKLGAIDFQGATPSHSVALSGDLVVISNPPLQHLFAQHLFTSFIWAMSDVVDPISGETNLSPTDPLEWTNFRLENSTIRRVVQGVQQAGLGTAEEIYTYIIPPLGIRDKLPPATAVVDLARKQARYRESLQQWKKATEAYLWLFQTCKAFNPKGPVAVKATALLMENFGFVNFSVELGRQQLQVNRVMEELRTQMLAELRTAHPEVLTAVGHVYAAEHLDGWSSSTLKTLGISVQRQASVLDDQILMRSPSHSKVFTAYSKNIRSEDFDGIDINTFDILGRTPLHYSILLTRDHTTRLLISLGADPNARNSLDWTPLHYACWFGNESVGWQLLRGADVDSRGTDGATPLHCASKRGHFKMVAMLLDTGANVQIVDSSRKSALHWAAFHGFEHIVGPLLRAGAPTNARDNQGRTPLHLSAVTGSDAATMALLNGGADAAAKDRNGASPQQLAAENNHHGLAKVLMERRGINTDVKRQAPLSWAADSGHEDVVRKLVEGGIVNPNAKDDSDGLTPLASAARNGHAGVVEFLVTQTGVETTTRDENGRTPLSLAAEKGHGGAVMILVEHGDADGEDNNHRTPLSWAAEMGHASVVKTLLGRQDISADKRSNKHQTPLSLAAAAGREVVKILAERADVDLDAQDDSGRTPLSHAAGEGYHQIVEFLTGLDRFDADCRDCFGQTPLSWAAEAGYVNVVKLLAEKRGCDPDSKDFYGQAPLSWAAEKGHDNVVRFLISREDVAVNWKDKDGQTAMWWTADQGHESTVKVLLECGHVDPDCKNNESQTPLMRAAKNGHDGVVTVLAGRSDVNADTKDEAGRTPLSLAAELGHERVVKALTLVDGIDVNTKDNAGRTPLSWAAGMGHENTVRTLLNRLDIDINARDKHDHSPLWWAIEYNQRIIIELLEHLLTQG